MTPGAGPSAETECEANARAPTPKRGTPRLRHADTDPYPLRLLSIGDIGSRTRRRRLTGNRTLSMCRSSYQPLRSGSASEAILCSGVVRRGLGRRACARTHESGRAPRRRLAPGPQPGPPCPTTTALRPLRRRPAPTSFASVGCSLAPSPTAPSPFASSRAKRSRLRHRRPPPRFPAPPPGGRLRLAPWPDARPCAETARSGTEQRPPRRSLLRPRTAPAAAAAPSFPISVSRV